MRHARTSAGAAIVVAAAVAAAAAAAPPQRSPALLDKARAVYTVNCQPCHGAAGDGNGPVAFSIRPRPRNFLRDPFKGGDSLEQVFATITSGLPKTLMVGYPTIPEEQRWGIAYLVLDFRRRTGPTK